MKIVILLLLMLEFIIIGTAELQGPEQHDSKHTKCYENLGCFSILPPFSPEMPLPMSPSEIGTTFYLRTRQNLDFDQSIEPDAANLTASYYDPLKPTKIIVHGFVMVNSGLAKWVPEVTQSILYQEDVNVIQVNWVKGANVEYDNAASNTRIVGAQIAYLINMLMEVHQAKAEDFHLIGFSLGAHVMGFAGKKVQTGGKKKMVGRITGLDPANPGFNYDSPVVRLDKTDAKFVDVVHTDTETILVMASGMNRNLGHIDFYPNGGANQVGCNGWSKSWMSSITDRTTCDHLRAPELFKASINATGDHHHLMGYKCKDFEKFKRGVCLRCRGPNTCRRMGYWAKPLSAKKRQVQYYLYTSGEEPFTVKHYQIQIHWRKSDSSSPSGFKAKLFVTLHGDKSSSEEIALNEGATFHVYAGKTTRFLVTIDANKDIGQVQRVTFRWERPSYNTWFWADTELVNLKRIKIFDGEMQKRFVFLPLGRNRTERIHSHFVQPGEEFELLSSKYIRSLYPKRRYTSLTREEKSIVRNIIRPRIVRVNTNETLHVKNDEKNENVIKHNKVESTTSNLNLSSST